MERSIQEKFLNYFFRGWNDSIQYDIKTNKKKKIKPKLVNHNCNETILINQKKLNINEDQNENKDNKDNKAYFFNDDSDTNEKLSNLKFLI